MSITFRRVTPPMPPRVDRASRSPNDRRALQDALAWPIVAILLVGAGAVFLLPRLVPARFLALAVGVVFAVVTFALVATLSLVVDRWLGRLTAVSADDAERYVRTMGVAGLATVPESQPLARVASAYADAGARAALRSSERETNEWLAQLGSDAATATERALESVRDAIGDLTSAPGESALVAARAGVNATEDSLQALRRVTAAVPPATAAVDLVELLRAIAADLMKASSDERIAIAVETERALVMVNQPRMHAHVLDLLRMARAASPPGGVLTVHISRVFRASVEDTPVRRAGDSRLTIVPRASTDSLRAWVQRAQPGAELVSVVISDSGAPPSEHAQQRAFDAFATVRPGDPHGVALATIRRTVVAANGTIWIAAAREGGTAVHLLLPIAAR
jgi:signal transduction histidine kinase